MTDVVEKKPIDIVMPLEAINKAARYGWPT